MVVRVRSVASIAALTIAAWPSSAQAQESPTPNISCTNPTTGALTGGDGGTVSGINWGDGFGFGAPNILVGDVPAVQFDCNGSMYSHDVSGSMFSVNFGPIRNSSDSFLKIEGDLKLQLSGTQEYKEFKEGKILDVTEFDLSLTLYKVIDGALVLDHKDYFGLKVDSAFGDALSDQNKLSVDTVTGNVILDPPIPGGSATIELITTPGGPTPEPATFALFGTGLLAAARALRRKSRR